MKHEPVPSGKRRLVEVYLDQALLDEAAALGIDLNRMADRALAIEVKQERDRRCKEDGRAWPEQVNAWVEKNGLPLAHLRLF